MKLQVIGTAAVELSSQWQKGSSPGALRPFMMTEFYGSDVSGSGDGVLIVLSHFIFFGTSFSSFPVISVSYQFSSSKLLFLLKLFSVTFCHL